MTRPRETTIRRAASVGHSAGLWFPRQHGAWAMLAVPLLLGVAASRPVGSQLLLAFAVGAGYLALATSESLVRAHDRTRFVPSLVVYAAVAAAAGLPLLVIDPLLLAAAAVLLVASAATLLLARRRGRPVLPGRLVETGAALVLTPAAASLAGTLDGPVLGAATLLAAMYLLSTVLVVRSAIRERGNQAFAAGSAAYHLVAVGLASFLLPAPYVVVWAVLAARAIGVPWLQRRVERGPHRLRPIHLGLVELAGALLVVATSFVVRP